MLVIMNRLLLSFLAGLLLCGCGKVSAVPPEYQGETAVYVTKTGNKYHTASCSSLKNSRRELSLAGAVAEGYEPCSRCKPPVLSVPAGRSAGIEGTAGDSSGTALYRVNAEQPLRCEAVDFSRLLRAEVTGHVDGDTVRVQINNPPPGLRAVETIRLIGVDTPETVHPKREVEAFGKEASDFTKSKLLGKTVLLAFDWDLRDRYGRLLAYIYTEDKKCHNAEIIRHGYGHAYTRFAFRFLDEFRALENEARAGKRGLWG
jgi:micrococcal nuclease